MLSWCYQYSVTFQPAWKFTCIENKKARIGLLSYKRIYKLFSPPVEESRVISYQRKHWNHLLSNFTAIILFKVKHRNPLVLAVDTVLLLHPVLTHSYWLVHRYSASLDLCWQSKIEAKFVCLREERARTVGNRDGHELLGTDVGKHWRTLFTSPFSPQSACFYTDSKTYCPSPRLELDAELNI